MYVNCVFFVCLNSLTKEISLIVHAARTVTINLPTNEQGNNQWHFCLNLDGSYDLFWPDYH